ncbi:MAG TPA: YihY/virulence factor BrkB family protein [Thermoanaerobaculia bacterium]|nr:YihY/virulence factor BrkB family protein [Thermoanaerobaculia bacterium]
MNVKSGFGLLKDSFKEWKEDGALDLGASLAYYTIFSLAPMLLIALSVASLFWERGMAQRELMGQMEGLVGQQGAQAVQTMLANAGREGSGVLGTIIGLVTVVFGATGVFAQLQKTLNRIWEVEAKPGGGIWSFVRTRLLSFGMVLGIGFLLLVSLVFSTMMASLDQWAEGLVPGVEILFRVLTFVVSFALITGLFAMIFKYLPDVKITWRDVWIGAAATALLFTIGKFLIGLYLGRSTVASSFGAAGSLIILLLWVYYSAQILFFGAEFTQVYASRYGSRIQPDEHARPVVARKEVASTEEWRQRKEARREEARPDGTDGTPERRSGRDRRSRRT